VAAGLRTVRETLAGDVHGAESSPRMTRKCSNSQDEIDLLALAMLALFWAWLRDPEAFRRAFREGVR
jgi:hypothetical protein